MCEHLLTKYCHLLSSGSSSCPEVLSPAVTVVSFLHRYLLLKTHQLSLDAFLVALKFMHVEDVDIDEVQCILANLIYMVRAAACSQRGCGVVLVSKRPFLFMKAFSSRTDFSSPVNTIQRASCGSVLRAVTCVSVISDTCVPGQGTFTVMTFDVTETQKCKPIFFSVSGSH